MAVSSWKTVLMALVLCVIPLSGAQAGSNQSNGVSKFTQQQLTDFSKKVERTAASKGARVFILARVGRPAEDLPQGIDFTHVGIAVYRHIKTDSGKIVPGYVVHNLYIDDERAGKSKLINDFAFNFFAGSTALKAGILVPDIKLQKRLYELVNSNAYASLHNDNYSTLSNPDNSQYQNCTEFVLDVMNAAIYQTTDVTQIKANTRAYFEPTLIKESRLKLALGAAFIDHIEIDDHKGKVYTATFGSIRKYMEQYGLVSHAQIVF